MNKNTKTRAHTQTNEQHTSFVIHEERTEHKPAQTIQEIIYILFLISFPIIRMRFLFRFRSLSLSSLRFRLAYSIAYPFAPSIRELQQNTYDDILYM